MTTQASFYWHDYETWGLSPALDRPSQFAGIRTDMNFNIIGEPEMFYCRMSDDYLPSPEAAIVTGITPELTQSEGYSEAEFAARIQHSFTQNNTCVVGYNSIRFDDEVSRNIFYRNFYDPYEYCWKNGNSRWDIIDLLRATYALRPGGIEWPKNDDGLPSFRLELLTAANGIGHEQAHDALSDVYATIAMAKLVKQKSAKIFDYYFALRDKNAVKALIDVKNRKPLVHVSGMFGSARNNISLVLPMVWHPVNSNAVVVVDLARDISPLLELTAEQIVERLYTRYDELGDKLPVPLKLVHINKCPFLAPEKTMQAEDCERLGFDKQACLDNFTVLQQNPQLDSLLVEVFSDKKEFNHQYNVDAMLYDGFFSFTDKKAFNKIRQTEAEKLSELELVVNDGRFSELFFRYRARNFPDTLSATELASWQQHRHATLQPMLTDYFERLDSLRQQYENDQHYCRILQSLYLYVKQLTADLAQ